MVYFFLTFIENILSSIKICLEGKVKSLAPRGSRTLDPHRVKVVS